MIVKRKKRVVAIALTVAAAAVLLLAVSIPLINDFTARAVLQELESAPLPDGAELCDTVWSAGKINGNGNGMQYFGAILIKSEMTREELDNHYAPYRANAWSCLVEPQEGPEITVIDHGGLPFSVPEDAAGSESHYIVYSWGDSGFPLRNLDLRGH